MKPKRLNKQSVKIKMKRIKKDIFKGAPITFGIATVTDMKDVTTTTNIDFFNYRCNYVNKVIHGKAKRPTTGVTNIDGIDIWNGLTLVCKKLFENAGGFKTYVNNMYRVDGTGKYIKLVDTSDDSNVFSMDRNMLWKIFSLAYCSTCHSVQGCIISDEVTIFDADTPYVDRYLIYTALTRCRDVQNITIFLLAVGSQVAKASTLPSSLELGVGSQVVKYLSLPDFLGL